MAQRLFGKWDVYVDGTHESTSYLTEMWVLALRHVPESAPIKRILMLGLALGSNIQPLQRRFPGCHVTIVEWDPEMIRLYREVGPKNASIEILEGDAAIVVPGLKEPYDLIVADMFTGPNVGAPMRQEAFYGQLARLTKPTGFLLVNYYANPELAEMLRPRFDNLETWTWHTNHLVLAEPPLPKGYIPYRGEPHYLKRECGTSGWRRLVGAAGGYGTAWGFGPFRFARYDGDREPVVDDAGPARLTYWQRTTRRETPAGWSRSLIGLPTRLTGFVDLETSPTEAGWTSHARRHIKHWRRQEKFVIEDVDVERFREMYRRSKLPSHIRKVFNEMLQQKKRDHGARLHCFGLIRVSDGFLRGGFACLDIPESRQSIHIASFVMPDAERAAGGYGLVERWFRHGREQGLRFMDFDIFWAPGNIPAWKGFSKFKSQFGVTFIPRPPLLARWTGSWKKTFGL